MKSINRQIVCSKTYLFRLFYLILQPLVCKKVQSTRITTSKNEAI